MTPHIKKLGWVKGSRPWYDHLLYWLIYSVWNVNLYIGNGIEIGLLGVTWVSLNWKWPNETGWNVYLQVFTIESSYDVTQQFTLFYYSRSHDVCEAYDYYPTLDSVRLELLGHVLIYKDDLAAIEKSLGGEQPTPYKAPDYSFTTHTNPTDA